MTESRPGNLNETVTRSNPVYYLRDQDGNAPDYLTAHRHGLKVADFHLLELSADLVVPSWDTADSARLAMPVLAPGGTVHSAMIVRISVDMGPVA